MWNTLYHINYFSLTFELYNLNITVPNIQFKLKLVPATYCDVTLTIVPPYVSILQFFHSFQMFVIVLHSRKSFKSSLELPL